MFKKLFKKRKEENKVLIKDESKSMKKQDTEDLQVNNEITDNQNQKEEKNDKANERKLGFLNRLKAGLEKTRKGITEKVDTVLKSYRKIDEELFEELEEILITSDVGVNTTLKIIEDVKDKVKERKIENPAEIKDLLKEELCDILTSEENYSVETLPSPCIILIVGVNGVGKTTTIGKLAHRFKNNGKKVIVAAGDTFRAAAIEQLTEWCNRAGVDIVANKEGTDPAAVIFDAIQAAKARKADILICDTAGRLHNKKNLMNELGKVFKIVEREYPEAKREVLLVLDATTGQNAVLQAKTFSEVCNVTGIVLTKLDGTAKGGVVIAVQSELGVPVKLIGVGEGIEDLQDFNAKNFVDVLFSE
jgi:fused signal recognition particle receptor